jgi:succinate-semialdehyde dehydrogenase/glutarate-semialdehyde dehydrogenase
MSAYSDVLLHIAGRWRAGGAGQSRQVINPATGETIGTVAEATRADLDEALEATARGFAHWRNVSAFERGKIMHAAAQLLRDRAEDIARLMTLEQGKPIRESRIEVLAAADTTNWLAEEGRRAYGRIVPARATHITQMVVKEPVGPVAAFTPWNFPINQIVRKLASALATGCSIIVKAPEETPASPAALIRAFLDAGVPGDVIGLVYGEPSEISAYLIPHPTIRKITFTGSTAVGKHLAALAGQHMKRVTMELGGHAPVIICDDADVETAASQMAGAKFRNAGQVCTAPTRFLVQSKVFDHFVGRFTDAAAAIKVGDGLDEAVQMGPLANDRRVGAMERLIGDAIQKGAEIRTGGQRIGNKGFFFAPTVVTGVHRDMQMMNDEPFGPLAMVLPFADLDEAVAEANRLPFGLAAYAYTRSAKTSLTLGQRVESGMLTINHNGLALPEIPFGGVKDSGYGSEGGSEAIEAYLNPKLVTQAAV